MLHIVASHCESLTCLLVTAVFASSLPLALALSLSEVLSSLFRTSRGSQNGEGCNLKSISGVV